MIMEHPLKALALRGFQVVCMYVFVLFYPQVIQQEVEQVVHQEGEDGAAAGGDAVHEAVPGGVEKP